MKYKKIMLILIMAIFLVSIAGVCAADANDTIVTSEDNLEIDKTTDDTIGVGEDTDLASSEENEILTEGEQTFSQLNETINGNADKDIYLNGNYKYSSGDGSFKNGIIIDRDVNIYGNGHTINGSGEARIFKINSGNVVFYNITFVNGTVTGYTGFGGAINGNCKAINCTFKENHADSGGAMYGGSAVNCTFSGNAASYGGAMYGGSAVNCTFDTNFARINGGAMCDGSAVNCIFSGNAARNGGAMYGGSAVNCTFSENSASYGGAMCDGSAVNCTFSGNSADEGGAMYGGSAVNCIFSGNIAPMDGGAMNGGSAVNCTFSENSASYGGAMCYVCYLECYGQKDGYESCEELSLFFDVKDFTSTYNSNKAFYISLINQFREVVMFINVGVVIFKDDVVVRSYSSLSGDSLIFDLAAGNYTAELTVTYPGITQPEPKSITLKVTDGTTFWDLNQTINGNTNDTITLDKNYTFNPDIDSAFTQGIMINRPVTINGNGYTINATGKARIFKVTSNDMTLNNITFTEGNTTGNGGAIYWSSSNANILNCCFVNNTANGYGGANYFYNAVTNVTLTGNFTNNRAEVSGGANCFRLAVTNVALTGNFTNNRANVYDGGANYFFDAVTDVILTGDFNNNTAIRFGGANCFWGEVTNVNLTCDFNNNRAETESGGANFFVDAVTNVALTGDFNNNSAKTQGGANCFDKAVTNVTLTGNYINNTGKNVIYIGNSVSGNVIRDSIFINNAPINVTKGNISVIDNWFGNNVTDYDVKPDVGIDLDNWLFLNATADYNVIPVFNSSSIVFKLYLYNSTAEEKKVSEYDNALLMPINLTITSANGDVDSSVANFGESIRYTATHAGDGSVTATLGTAEFTIKLNNIKADSNLSVENQVIIFGENATVALNYNSNATGKVNITLTGKKGTFTYTNLDLNATIMLPKDIPADEYNVTVSYSGDDNFMNATANATLTINKANATLTINDNVTFDYGTNGSTTVSYTNASGIVAEVIGQPNAIVLVNDTTITVSGLNAGNYTLTVTTITDANHNIITRNATITVNKVKTQLTANAITSTYNVNKDLVITLKDANGNALSGMNVTVDLNGAKVYTTDKNGQVKVSTSGLVPKVYTATITFDGDNKYIKSTSSVKVTVNKAKPKIVAKKKTYKAKKKTKKFTITLKDNKNKPIKNAKVRLIVKKIKKTSKKKKSKKSKKKYKPNIVKTNKKGKATFKVKRFKKGTYQAKIIYKGNNYYTKVTKTVKIKLK